MSPHPHPLWTKPKGRSAEDTEKTASWWEVKLKRGKRSWEDQVQSWETGQGVGCLCTGTRLAHSLPATLAHPGSSATSQYVPPHPCPAQRLMGTWENVRETLLNRQGVSCYEVFFPVKGNFGAPGLRLNGIWKCNLSLRTWSKAHSPEGTWVPLA